MQLDNDKRTCAHKGVPYSVTIGKDRLQKLEVGADWTVNKLKFKKAGTYVNGGVFRIEPVLIPQYSSVMAKVRFGQKGNDETMLVHTSHRQDKLLTPHGVISQEIDHIVMVK